MGAKKQGENVPTQNNCNGDDSVKHVLRSQNSTNIQAMVRRMHLTAVFMESEVPGRLLDAHDPQFLFAAVMRDPLDRTLSHYAHARAVHRPRDFPNFMAWVRFHRA